MRDGAARIGRKQLSHYNCLSPTPARDDITNPHRRSAAFYRILGLSGYARMDFRLTDEGRLYLLEPNPNPDLALDEDFVESAHAAGIPYEKLVQRILNFGLRYHRHEAPTR